MHPQYNAAMKRSRILPALWALLLTGTVIADDLPPAGPNPGGDQALLAIPQEADTPLDPAVVAAFAGAAEAYGAKQYGAARAAWHDLAKDGFGPAQYNLAVMLEHGRGGDVDYAAAAEWYARAAERDVAPVMIDLARLLFEGRGVRCDRAEDLRRLRMGAMLGAP